MTLKSILFPPLPPLNDSSAAAFLWVFRILSFVPVPIALTFALDLQARLTKGGCNSTWQIDLNLWTAAATLATTLTITTISAPFLKPLHRFFILPLVTLLDLILLALWILCTATAKPSCAELCGACSAHTPAYVSLSSAHCVCEWRQHTLVHGAKVKDKGFKGDKHGRGAKGKIWWSKQEIADHNGVKGIVTRALSNVVGDAQGLVKRSGTGSGHYGGYGSALNRRLIVNAIIVLVMAFFVLAGTFFWLYVIAQARNAAARDPPVADEEMGKGGQAKEEEEREALVQAEENTEEGLEKSRRGKVDGATNVNVAEIEVQPDLVVTAKPYPRTSTNHSAANSADIERAAQLRGALNEKLDSHVRPTEPQRQEQQDGDRVPVSDWNAAVRAAQRW